MFRKLFVLIVFAGLFLAGTGNYDTNAKIKAVYIFNFTKYIEWPKEYRESDFIIGVLGDSPLYSELEGMAVSKKVFGQKIEVRKFKSAAEIGKCHMLYVARDAADPLNSVIGKVKEYSTLLITDKEGLAKQGSAINFVVLQNRQKFELNQSNALKYNLKVSNSLEALAIIVN